MKLRPSTIGILVLAVLLIAVQSASACPTCKDQLAADPGAANLARGYGWSIVFMLSMPYLILAGLGGYFYWEIRKAKARQAVLAPAGRIDASQPPAAGPEWAGTG
jgi:hypothetical protein